MVNMFGRKNKNIQEEKQLISNIKLSNDVIKLVVLRVVCFIVLLASAVIITMAVIFKPWKLEFTTGSSVTYELSVWEVCRNSPRGVRCYEGELDVAPAWFLAFRWFLMLSVIFQYIATFYYLIMLLIRKNEDTRAFWVASLISLISAAMVLTAMVILVAFWDFGFLDDSRMVRMGWREDMDVEEASGWTRDMGYISIGFMLASSFLCLYTHFKDDSFARHYEVNRMKSFIGSQIA